MVLNFILGALALLSLMLLFWQWVAARLFPLHRRAAAPDYFPGLTLLKPLKGCDSTTADCLRSWLAQDYPGPLQVLFAVARADDPVCPLVEELLAEFPKREARLVVCRTPTGINLKVSKLAEVESLAQHEVLVISDADVRVPPGFLANLVAPLREPDVGLVNCFYRLANPATLAMRWEAVAINADFWSQVLQSRTLKPMDFALGAVMATRRRNLAEIGGFSALVDCLADDYQLGHGIARRGHRIEICPVVVECWSEPMNWAAVWKHQLRWARTIRVCQPAPYFFSLLSNPTLWPLLWLTACPGRLSLAFGALCLLARGWVTRDLVKRMAGTTACPAPGARSAGGAPDSDPALPPPIGFAASIGVRAWLGPLKDLLQAAIWLLSFTGNRIEWRGERLRLRRDGTLQRG